jgi:WD40 repeat protein
MNVPRTFSGVATATDQAIVRIGGKDASGNVLASIEIYEEQLPAAAGWTSTGSMANPRSDHGQVLLANGKTLVAGGQQNTAALSSSELYDATTGQWSPARSLGTARSYFTLTRLPNGKVLAAGGGPFSFGLSSAEIYDPIAGTWSAAAPMAYLRGGQRAALLPYHGMVLVAGGGTATSEIYDWINDKWLPPVSMNAARTEPSIAVLPNGLVMVAGGIDNSFNALSSVELYDPVRNTWTPTGSLNVTRAWARAALLASGKVLIAGGYTTNYVTALTSIEVYDPSAGTWSIVSQLTAARGASSLTSLPNGEFLVAGGLGSLYSPAALATTDLFDESGDRTFATSALITPRGHHGGTLLPNGKVLVTGGLSDFNLGDVLNSAELYQETYPVVTRAYLPVVFNQSGG